MTRIARRDRIFLNNPVIMQGMGLAPLVVAATTARNALMLSVAVILLLTPVRVIAALLARTGYYRFRGLIYCLTSATVYIGVYYALQAIFDVEILQLGIYLPLIVVNCIILGRAEAFASKNPVGLSALDGLGMGAGFTAALVLMGGIREFLGNGTLFGWPEGGLIPPITIFVLPAGGFFVFGMLIWLTNRLSKKLEGDANRKELSGKVCAACGEAGCPHAAACALAANEAADPEKPGVEEAADQ